jgi:tRNA A-37 threonylcarbamoyl transferase component Bud32
LAASSTPTIPGLPDRFKPRKYLARTPYGEVVEAYNHDRACPVALKLLRADGSHAEVARAMFRREVEALKGLRHPAIVQILDSFECDDNLLVIELELVPGGLSLAKLIDEVRVGRRDRPTLAWRVQMAGLLAEAVSEAHRRHVIHRDIKPGNVLWHRDEDGLKLADFGIAAVLPLTVREQPGVTLRSFHTKPFASPEQLLQEAPGFPADVYGFSLLTASLLCLHEPTEDFEPDQLQQMLVPALREMAEEAIPAVDVDELAETLAQGLRRGADERPSLVQIRAVLIRLQAALVPRPQAFISLTKGATDALAAAGFVAHGRIADDFNADARIRLERDERGEVIRLYGRSLFAVLRQETPNELLAVGAGQNAGPVHEAHRRAATECSIRVRVGPGEAVELINFAREANQETTRRATTEIVDRARLVIDIERERLPVFIVQGQVQGGEQVYDRREIGVGRASGREGSQVERVEVKGGFRLMITQVRVASAAVLKNVVKATLKAGGVNFEEPEVFDDAPSDDWYSMFDDPSDIDVLDDTGHLVGKVTGYDRTTNTVQVQTDKKRKMLRVGQFFLKNYQKERLLRQQEVAIDALVRGETSRPDMPHLLADGAAHRMGDKPFVDLLQKGLTPEHRVRGIIDRILASDGVFCLQGPPGTGKTTIITEVVAQVLEREPRARILVCAQANDAVANAIEKLLKVRKTLNREWIVVRDVRSERAREEGPWAGIEAAYKEFVGRVKGGVREFPAPGDGGAAQVEWVNCVDHRVRNVGADYHGLVQVWGTTTARSLRPLDGLEGEPYDLVIIDEAAKATVGEVLVPIVHALKLLLVGDQKQLPPFLEDTTAKALQELGISEDQAKYSLFEHLFTLVPIEHRDMLDMQFRMHPTIGEVVSQLFYDGRVKNGPGTADRPLPGGVFDRPHRVMWVDVEGRDYKVGKTSRANDEERRAIEQLLDRLDADARQAGMKLDVAVIAAYRGQADKLQAELKGAEKRWKHLSMKAATVDSFQGREADVVIYSLVRTGDAERKFLADGRRFNVALSRAKSLLVMVGDRTGARGTGRLRQLLELIPEENQLSLASIAPSGSLGSALASALMNKTRGRP